MKSSLSLFLSSSVNFRIILKYTFRGAIVILLVFNTLVVYSNNEIDSLQKRLVKASSTEKLDLTLSLSKAYWSVMPTKGLALAKLAILMAQKEGNQEKKAKALLYGGVNYWALGEYDNAMHYYDSCLRIAENISNRKLAAFAMNNMGMIYQDEGDYTKAMINFNHALVIMKALDDKIEYAKIMNSLGKLNTELHKYKEALKNYQIVLDLVKNSNELKLYFWVLSDIGEVYFRINQPEKALSYFELALRIANNLDDKVGKAMIYNNIGRTYLSQRNFTKTKSNFQKAIAFARQSKARDQIMITWQNMSDMYSNQGEYKESLKYFKLYKEMSDSIYSEKKMKNISNLQIRYETEAKGKEIELLRKDAELNRLRISQQKSFRNLLMVLLLVVLMITTIIYGRLNIKRQANKLLAEKNDEIENKKAELHTMMEHLQQSNKKLEEQKAEIEKQVETIREVNSTKDRFFSIIAHDLKSPFNSILGFSSLLVEQIQENNHEGIEEYAIILQNSSQRVYDLLTNLLEWARSQTGRMEFNPERTEIVALIDNVIELSKDAAQQKSITISKDMLPNAFVLVDKYMISTVLRNLFMNAIKFTKPGGKIVISAQQKKNQLEISVSDNGVGIDKDAIDKLFRIDESYSTAGTQNEKGTGLGLILCRDFVERHRGQIGVESVLGKGSKFFFNLPFEEMETQALNKV